MKLRSIVFAVSIVLILSVGLSAQLPARYTRYSQALSLLSNYQSEYPEICKLDTMGYSSRDSVPILRFKISDNPGIDEDEPAVFLCGGVHADEVLGVEVVIYFINDIMAKYARRDSTTLRYIDNIEIFCIPFINPEGHIVVENGDTDWRKNKYDNNHDGIFNYHDGVDNNRNYDFGWSLDSAPDAIVPESLQYKGTAPFTQLENIAMRDFANHYRPLIAIDYHSPTYGRAEKAYYNWYWYPPEGHGMSPDEAFMLAMCREYASRITNDMGDSTYEARRGLVDKGDFKTFFYANYGTASFSVEISDTTIQNPVKVDTICIHHLPSQYYLLNRALGPGITGVIRDSVTLEPLEAEVQVLERINADINPRMSRPDFGRYRRLLGAGTYTLKFLKTGYRNKTVNSVVVTSTGGPTTVNVLLSPTNPRPPTPILLYPPNDTTVIDTMPALTWHISPYATKYLLEVFSDSLLAELLYSDSTITDTSRVPVVPESDSVFYWRVKGGNNYGWGPYSLKRTFVLRRITGVNPEQAMPVTFSLEQNYPNPFNMETTISFSIPSGKNGELAIYDISGRLVRNLHLRGSASGTQRIIWDGHDSIGQEVKSGVYFYRLKVGDKTLSNKMVLLK
jgi:hypothetical protein